MSLALYPAIAYGTVKRLTPGMQTMSLPPQCRCALTIDCLTMVRGKKCPEIMFFYIGEVCPVKEGAMYVFGGEEHEDLLVFKGAKQVSSVDEARKMTEEILKTPYGWESDTKSPFTKKWPGPTTGSSSVCSVSGRPTYAIPTGVELSVEQIIPPDANEYKNPYGNGEFKITVTNKTEKEVTVPVVKAGGKYDFEQSLVVTCVDIEEGNSKNCIFPENLPGDAAMTTIPAGGSISGTVNTLKLKCVEWPCGGNRVYFNFGLGGLVAQSFFYYYSSVHDAMRQ